MNHRSFSSVRRDETIGRPSAPISREAEAERDDLIRVVYESGEDYLYSSELFVPIESPEGAEEAFAGVP